MVDTVQSTEAEVYRIILFGSHGAELLVLPKNGRLHLPTVQRPGHQRVAQSLTSSLRSDWLQETIRLFSLDSDQPESECRYEVMQSCALHPSHTPGSRWASIASLAESDFEDTADPTAIAKANAECQAYAVGRRYGPFARLGWFSELTDWIRDEIRRLGLSLNGRFSQLNASPTFNLIRFETDGPAVWFKAVGAPNQREYPLTLALGRLFCRFVPEVIAARPEWNGWLAKEAEGSLLHECCGPASWKSAARDLAELQIHSLGRSSHLVTAGARDLRARALSDRVEPFFQAAGELMERQTKTSPAAISREELRSLAARVQDALTGLAGTDFPPALGHLDINPGNIVCSPVGSMFLDWAEAFVGHPFLTFEYLAEHFRQAFGQEHLRETDLTDSYCAPWRAFVSPSAIRSALELAPLVAAFAYAVGNDLWTDSRRIQDERAAGYLRGLTRRMDREARALQERSLPCRS